MRALLQHCHACSRDSGGEIPEFFPACRTRSAPLAAHACRLTALCAARRVASARKWQHYLDLSAPHVGPRWGVSALVVFIYCLRVYLINGWYIITYGLGIYVLNLLIGFLSPQSDPETEGPVRSGSRSRSPAPCQAAPTAQPPRPHCTMTDRRARARCDADAADLTRR